MQIQALVKSIKVFRNIASCLVKYKLIFKLCVKCILLFEKILLKFWSAKFLVPFEVKQKTFFLVSQVLSFRYTKQTSKNVAGTTFKHNQKDSGDTQYTHLVTQLFQLYPVCKTYKNSADISLFNNFNAKHQGKSFRNILCFFLSS